MIILTGPQSTPAELAELVALAGDLEVALCAGADEDWLRVTRLVLAPGWDSCPIALAHVAVADAFGVVVVGRSSASVAA